MAQKYMLRRSRAEVVKYCPEMAMPDAKLVMVKLEFAHEEEQEYYDDTLLRSHIKGDFKQKSETMLAALNKARAACAGVKGNPSTKVINACSEQGHSTKVINACWNCFCQLQSPLDPYKCAGGLCHGHCAEAREQGCQVRHLLQVP